MMANVVACIRLALTVVDANMLQHVSAAAAKRERAVCLSLLVTALCAPWQGRATPSEQSLQSQALAAWHLKYVQESASGRLRDTNRVLLRVRFCFSIKPGCAAWSLVGYFAPAAKVYLQSDMPFHGRNESAEQRLEVTEGEVGPVHYVMHHAACSWALSVSVAQGAFLVPRNMHKFDGYCCELGVLSLALRWCDTLGGGLRSRRHCRQRHVIDGRAVAAARRTTQTAATIRRQPRGVPIHPQRSVRNSKG